MIHFDRRITKLVLCLVVVVALLLGGLLILNTWEKGQTVVPPPSADSGDDTGDGRDLIWYDGGWYTPRTDLETVLLMGIDKAALDDDTLSVQGEFEQSDLMILLVLDKTAQTCTAIHINRDTMTEYRQIADSGRVKATVVGQITLAHAFGGDGHMRCRNAVWAVSNLFYGIKIDHYISIAMDGVEVLNDLVGGVTLEVMDDFSNIDPTLVKGETVTLHGRQALTYVRARSGMEDSSNLHRMERQRQYMDALQKQLAAFAENSSTSFSLIGAINDYLVSDCTAKQLSALTETLGDWTIGEYVTLEGEAVMGEKFVEFHPDEAALQQLVMERFYEKSDRAAEG